MCATKSSVFVYSFGNHKKQSKDMSLFDFIWQFIKHSEHKKSTIKATGLHIMLDSTIVIGKRNTKQTHSNVANATPILITGCLDNVIRHRGVQSWPVTHKSQKSRLIKDRTEKEQVCSHMAATQTQAIAPESHQNRLNAASIGPVPARLWHIVVCFQGGTYPPEKKQGSCWMWPQPMRDAITM